MDLLETIGRKGMRNSTRTSTRTSILAAVAIAAGLAIAAPAKNVAAMPVATPGQLGHDGAGAGAVEKTVVVCGPWRCYWRPGYWGYRPYPYWGWRRHYWWGWRRPWGWHRPWGWRRW